MPDTAMRAAFITETGPPETIRTGDLPLPQWGATDVLVKVDATAVNQVDTYIRGGRYPTLTPFPFIVGRDLVGIVADTGSGTRFEPGERVWCNSLGHDGRQGASSEYAVVPADRLYPLPKAAEPTAAVAALHPAATAHLALRRADLRAGDTVLIGGAAGSVGSCAVLFAKQAGARVIATERPADHQRCTQLGADAVFDFADPHLTDQVHGAAPGGVDIHWDTSGHAELNTIAPTVATKGRILVTAGREPQPPTKLWALYTRDISVLGFVISLATTAELADAAGAINRWLDGPGFALRISDILPLAETAKAHTMVEAGLAGKVVIDVNA